LYIFSHMIEENIALFISTHETLRAEKILKSENIDFKTVIKPRTITSECGFGLKFNSHYREKILIICKNNNLRLIGIFISIGKDIWKKIELN